MKTLESEFEVFKVVAIASDYCLIFCAKTNFSIPTFEIFNESLNGTGAKMATAQWTGESWALISFNQASVFRIEKMLTDTNSRYFWEISND